MRDHLDARPGAGKSPPPLTGAGKSTGVGRRCPCGAPLEDVLHLVTRADLLLPEGTQ